MGKYKNWMDFYGKAINDLARNKENIIPLNPKMEISEVKKELEIPKTLRTEFNFLKFPFFDLSKNTPENKSQDVEELAEDPGNMVIYKDVFEKLDSNENIEQTITDFLGSNWFDKTEKFV